MKKALRRCGVIGLTALFASLFGANPIQTPNAKAIAVNAEGIQTAQESGGDASPELEIYSICLNDSSGDSTLLDYGDTEILIDTGGGQPKAVANIIDVIERTVTDKKIEMVILTHGDSDHIGGFPSLATGIAGLGCSISNLVDFDDADGAKLFQSNTAALYRTARNGAVSENNRFTYSSMLDEGITKWSFDSKGTVNKSASSSNEDLNLTFMKSSASFSESGEPSEDEEGIIESTDKNIISVCTLFELHGSKMLFCGDLPEFGSGLSRADGESSLLEDNKELLRGPIAFYKASHHGSRTSNSDPLLQWIRPQTIAISCGSQYSFPNTDILQSFFQYTDRIYISRECFVSKDANYQESLWSDASKIKYNIKYRLVDGEFYALFDCDNDVFMNSSLLNGYLIDGSDENQDKNPYIYVYSLSNGFKDSPSNATYIKIGRIDILIDLGFWTTDPAGHATGVGATSGLQENLTIEYESSDIMNKHYSIIRKVEQLCGDRVLDYLVVSANSPQCFGYLLGNKSESGSGLLNDGYLKSIKNLIVSDKTPKEMTQLPEGSSDYTFEEYENEIKTNSLIENRYGSFAGGSSALGQSFYPQIGIDESGNPAANEGYAFEILQTEYNSGTDKNTAAKDTSLPVLLKAGNFKFLSLGLLSDGEHLASVASKSEISGISLFVVPNFGIADSQFKLSSYMRGKFHNSEYAIFYNCASPVRNNTDYQVDKNYEENSYIVYQKQNSGSGAYNGDLAAAVGLYYKKDGKVSAAGYHISVRCTKAAWEESDYARDGKKNGNSNSWSVSLYDNRKTTYSSVTKGGLAKSYKDLAGSKKI